MRSKHPQPDDETSQWASLYALSMLTDLELSEFEDHLRQGCTTCLEEIRSFEGVAAHLDFAAVPLAPPDGLTLRVLGLPPSPQESSAQENP